MMQFVAKKLDKRLLDLGATPIIERGLGDDQHPSGYEGALDPWMSSLWNVLHQNNPMLFPNGPEYETSNIELLDQPKIKITYHDAYDTDAVYHTVADLNFVEKQIVRARSMFPGTHSGKNRPDCFLRMVKNDPLSKVGCGKDVRHFELEPVSSSIQYEVGDVLEVLPGQSAASVDAFIKRCNLNPDSYIRVQPRDKDQSPADNTISTVMLPVRLRTFVELTMDIASASPRRYFFEVNSRVVYLIHMLNYFWHVK
nr:NADPH-dependent diflavin oxidoreductase 1 isoform X2 [Ipomoea batatas]GMD66968.1 NADPH-dependent diflavin oxidoreductase 1 isoform X2 [Ipomoea batatas]